MQTKLLWQQIPSTIISEIFCNSTYDGVVLDLEHGVFDEKSLFQCIQIITLYDALCYVRLSDLDDYRLKVALDASVDGIILSTVETEDYARTAIEKCKFPHEKLSGTRGLGLVRNNLWGQGSFKNKNVEIIGQIETRKGVRNLSCIKSAGLDRYLIGPYDISASMGIPGDFDNSEFKEQIDHIENNIPMEKLGYHLVQDVEQDIHKYTKYGFIAHGMDSIFLIDRLNKLSKLV